MHDAVNHLCRNGREISDEHLARLSHCNTSMS